MVVLGRSMRGWQTWSSPPELFLSGRAETAAGVQCFLIMSQARTSKAGSGGPQVVRALKAHTQGRAAVSQVNYYPGEFDKPRWPEANTTRARAHTSTHRGPFQDHILILI